MAAAPPVGPAFGSAGSVRALDLAAGNQIVVFQIDVSDRERRFPTALVVCLRTIDVQSPADVNATFVISAYRQKPNDSDVLAGVTFATSVAGRPLGAGTLPVATFAVAATLARDGGAGYFVIPLPPLVDDERFLGLYLSSGNGTPVGFAAVQYS